MISAWERIRKLKYVKFGLFDSPESIICQSLLDWKDLGNNRTGAVVLGESFLVFESDQPVITEAIPQKKGGVKYSIDQAKNPISIVFRPSGFYDENTLIAGKVGTISVNQKSVETYNLFRKTIIKNSKKIGYAYVCTDALDFMKNGGRMVTIGIGSPREYDLQFQ